MYYLLRIVILFFPLNAVSGVFETDEYNAQWGLGAVNAAGAYAKGYTGAGVTIGVVDTGLEADHQEISGKYVFGKDFKDPTSLSISKDTGTHGTGVASVAAGVRDGVGMHGVAYNADVAVGRIFNDPLVTWSSPAMYESIFTAVNYLADAGVRVINQSYGPAAFASGVVTYGNNLKYTRDYFEPSEARMLSGDCNPVPAWGGCDKYAEAIALVRMAVEKNALMVRAAGNDGYSDPQFMTALPFVYTEFEDPWLVVGAVDDQSTITSWSTRCGVAQNYCLVAPGASIKSANAANGASDYIMSGTSASAPMVSGVAALVAEAFPYLTVKQIKQILLTTATDLGDPGVDSIYGWGLVNAEAAVMGFKSFASGSLAITDNTDSEWTKDITGSGGFTKEGTGTLTLSGTNSYTGDTTVNAGALVVEGSLASNLTIAANGTLSGSGQIGNDVTVSGTLAPGQSPGTLTIAGSLSLASSSTTEIEVDGTGIGSGAGNYDRIILTGAGSVFTADGSINPILRGISGSANNNFTPTLGQSFSIINATGGISGSFNSMTQPTSGLAANTRFDLLYGDNKIDLVATPGSYQTFAGNLSTTHALLANLGTALDNARSAAGVKTAGDSKVFFDALYPLTEVAVGEAMVNLSGTIHSSLLAENVNLKHDLMRQIIDRDHYAQRAALSASSDSEIAAFIWKIGSTSFGDHKGDSQGFGYDFDRYDVIGGMDLDIGRNFQVGFGGGYMDSSVTEHAQNRGGSLENYLGFLSGRGEYNNFFSSATVGASHSIYKAGRLITLGTDGFVSGESGGTDIFGGFDVGYNYDHENFSLTPSVGFSFTSLDRDSFDEQGIHPGRLSLLRSQVFSTRSRVSVVGERVVSVMRDNDLTLNAGLAWQHELSAEGIAPEATILGSKLSVNAVRPVKDMLQFSGDIGFSPFANTLITVGYQGNLGNNYMAHNFRAGANFSW
jgi:subtilase-type serine protease